MNKAKAEADKPVSVIDPKDPNAKAKNDAIEAIIDDAANAGVADATKA